ncbi:hypothetical protein RUMOBE_02729 [Blautia obeum ATCC 29174]|uniref:Glycosyltransferase 2-like domain-containing protein n=1 Tax=Blautia obeum ATCC 29174 TaxID=411459 RepID=A5ZUP4_9FIRM|nr:hypothetical protein RUMOBE_02729 [Blautia obeum ATCC 29174]
MSILSVVLPAYNEEQMVGKTCRVLHEVLSGAGISYELVLVNDGSKDNTWNEILKAGEKIPISLESIFHVILGKRQLFLQDLHRHPAMWWQLWTVIFSIRQKH